MEDGIKIDLPIEDYHKNRTHISATQIKVASESLKKFKWYIDGKIPYDDKPHLQMGNAFELALMAPDEYLQKVAVFPDGELCAQIGGAKPRSTNKYKDALVEFEKSNKGRYIINDVGENSFEIIEEMLSSCFQDKIIQALVKNTEYQLSLFWTDPITGIKLKTRPDFCKRKKNVIVNLKTTLDGSPGAFSRDISKYRYDLQACIEIRGALNSGLMETVDSYFWLVVEKVPPFNATIYEFDKADQEQVDDNLSFLLTRLKRAQEQDLYPGYSDLADNVHGVLTARIWHK